MSSENDLHPDQYLVQGLLQSNGAVIDEIYRRYFPSVRKHITGNSGRMADAKDIFQEALITIYRKKADGGLTLNEPFGSYLHRLCKWLWLNELKKRKRQADIYQSAMESHNPHGPTHHRDLEHRRQRDLAFRKAFDAMGDLCKDLLRLSWTGLNLKQIGQKLGKSHGYLRRKRPECVREFIAMVKEEQL